MARRVRASTLENRTARLKMEPRKKPYHFTTIAPGLAVGYRRNKGPGKWVLRAADGHGSYWTDAIALADDRPATVAEALDVYERDLAARNGAAINARGVRNLLPAGLLAKPVALLTV